MEKTSNKPFIIINAPSELFSNQQIINIRSEINKDIYFLPTPSGPTASFSSLITIIINLYNDPIVSGIVGTILYENIISPLLKKIKLQINQKQLMILQNGTSKPPTISIEAHTTNSKIILEINDTITESSLKKSIEKMIEAKKIIDDNPESQEYYFIKETNEKSIELISMGQFVQEKNKNKLDNSRK